MRRMLIAAAFVGLAFSTAAGAAPGTASETGTIRFVVGTPPGGALDPYARIIADTMQKELGQTIIVENKPGANGNISANSVLQSPANGLTVCGSAPSR